MTKELIKRLHYLQGVADGIEARKSLRGFYVPQDTTDLLEAINNAALTQQTEPVNPDSTWSMDYGGGPAPLPQSGVREGMRVLREEDSYCPECGHNRDKSSISTITLPDGRHQCQKCSATWMESPTPAADQVNTDTVSVPKEPSWELQLAIRDKVGISPNQILECLAMLRAAQEGKK
jgi:hypothetical protein